MSFISYAQNFEDVMLWRALKNVERGFYIDIGAQDPVVDSVSCAFYEHGWRGIHIEPTKQYYEKLRLARPDETVLQLAIGNQVGTLTFYEFEDTGLSTADPDIAIRHKEAGYCCHQTIIQVISLDTLFERINVQDIHWLKIDVEGLEKAVLESWMISSVRPWVIVIESTFPLTQEESHDDWEQMLLNKGYQYIYFDGLNRFYVSSLHAELVSAFRSPPNIFDDFVLSGRGSQPFYKLVESKAQQAEARTEQAQSHTQQALARAAIAEAEIRTAQAQAQAHQALARAAVAVAEMRTAQEQAQAQQALARATIAEAEVRTLQAEAQAQQALTRAAVAEAESRTAKAETQSLKTASIAADLVAKLEATSQELRQVHQSNHHHWQLAESRHQHIETLLSSKSWRFSAPLRWVGSWTSGSSPIVLRQLAVALLQHAALYVANRRRLKTAAMAMLDRFPNMKNRLAHVLGYTTLQPHPLHSIQSHNAQSDIAHLTPRARQIYADLKTAMERRQKEIC